MNVNSLTLEDLVERHTLPRGLLDREVSREHLSDVSSLLEHWEKFARAAGLTEPRIVEIDRDGRTEEDRRYKALHMWHEKNAFLATYSELARILLTINYIDTACKVCLLLKQEESVPATGKSYL